MSSSRLWNPREVLPISRDCCCVGFAPSKGRKCRWRLEQGDLSKADTLIECIARQQPNPDALRSELYWLASHLLCRRWHQSQAVNMERKWAESMKSVYPYGMVLGQYSAQSSAFSRRNLFPSSSASSSSASVSLQRSSSSVSSVSTRNNLPLSNTSNTSNQNRHQSSTVRGSSLASTASLNARVQAQTSESISLASTARTQSRTITSTPINSTTATHSRAPNSSPSPPSITRSQASPLESSSNRSAGTDHIPPTYRDVQRRAIDDECHICKDDFQSNDLIMWCKAACGRSVHKNCFENWERACTARRRNTTCVLCRAAWEDQSAISFRGSNPCTRTHVRRLGIDEECPICQEDYRPDESTTWCKDGCGRSIHQDCFVEWRTHLDNNHISVTCIFCRRAWVSDCECIA